MQSLADKLPPEIARQIHPDWRKNEAAYWAVRDQLLAQYRDQWIGFADGAVIASGTSPVAVLHAAASSGRHPFVTCVGREEEPTRMRRVSFPYDGTYPGEPLPVLNKDRADSKETYTSRYVGYLRLGVHLLLVDVLPRPRWFSFSDAITSGLCLELPSLPPPFAATYRVGEVVPVADDMGTLLAVWRRSLKFGEPLPALPLPLSVHRAILIDLEETYHRAAKIAYLD